MALFSVALNFIQTYRSQEAVDSIRKEVAPYGMVLAQFDRALPHDQNYRILSCNFGLYCNGTGPANFNQTNGTGDRLALGRI
jgi:hypothetical protein